MDKEAVSQSIIGQLHNADYKVRVLEKLQKLSFDIVKELKYVENSSKIRVLNLLLLNAYRSFKSFITLLENNHFNDAFLLTRKIQEILIRMEYLAKTNTFDNYYRERSVEQAKMLHSLLHSHPIKNVSETGLWKIRNKIIRECKAIYTDQQNGTFVNTPNLEQMAEQTGMIVLYKKSYGSLSKFVHSNMSIENFYLYESDNKVYYHTEETDDNFNTGAVKSAIEDTLYCFYHIIVKYCSELNIHKDKIDSFNKEFYLFVALDLVTGKSKSNVDVTLQLVKHLTGIEIEKEEEDLEHEVLFIQDDITSFRESWTKLEALIQKKETELQNL
ncbi:hypothetical protein BTA37_25045 [Priestia megaterium]|uniref:DUF5677 domain-containing protein n=1 Tax=Priestia megaterium TaxID=1404 RepID=UPI00094D6897|nr:DUF5677 domain-containing protein [Priestia megaterium]OLO27527.1 hypothetical protein BTA37_25045 [Priestia megaterium]